MTDGPAPRPLRTRTASAPAVVRADPALVEKFRRLLTGEEKGYSATAWEELASVAARFYATRDAER